MKKSDKEYKLTGLLVFRMAMLVLFIMISYVFIMGIILYLFMKLKIISINGINGPIGTLISMLITSIIIGSVIGFVLSYKAMKPIRDLSEASKAIAEGDYQVLIDEIPISDSDNEINNLIRNFNKMAKKLSETETLRSDFIANVSHEFKTPIATIQGYVTLLSDDSLSDADRKKYTQIVYAATNKLSNLTSNILKISKIDNQEIKVESHEFNLAEQIRNSIIMLESSWEEKNINLDIDLSDCTICNDEILLQHVWNNILANAIKFSNDSGTIKVALTRDSRDVRIEITDNGIGMSHDTIDHMFDKFYQGDKSHSHEGNGLGMTLVKKIVTLCKGSIMVESELNKGTSVFVSLPVIIKNDNK